MYLIDTNVVSEARKGRATNPGVRAFFRGCTRDGARLWLSAVTVGELRRGVDLIRHRGDGVQAKRLEIWLGMLVEEYGDSVLPFDLDAAQIWGRLRVPRPENILDKQIAATALLHDLTVVTRNVGDFTGTGVRLLNPFTADD